jgi:ketosteroid isomerase-like protein
MSSRYLIVLAGTMLLIVGVWGSAFAQEDAEAIVTEIYDRYALSVSTGDVDLHMSFWDDNGIKMSPDAPALIGKEGIRALMEMIFGVFDSEAPFVLDEAVIAGDWALGRATWTLSSTPKEGGETSTRSLKSLDIFRKQADGSWKLYVDCWNYDAPLPAAKLASTSWGPGLAKMAQEDAEVIVTELFDQYTLALESGDLELYLSLHEDNVVKMAPDAPVIIGKEALRPVMGGLLGLFNFTEFPIFFEEAEIAGDWMFSRVTFTQSLTPKEGGETSTSSGKALTIFKRQADGSWKVYIDCFNYDASPPVTSVEATSWGQVKFQVK